MALNSVDNEKGPVGQPHMVNTGLRETDEVMYEEQDTFMHKLNNPMSFSAVIGDTMYLHQALAQLNRQELIKAIVKNK